MAIIVSLINIKSIYKEENCSVIKQLEIKNIGNYLSFKFIEKTRYLCERYNRIFFLFMSLNRSKRILSKLFIKLLEIIVYNYNTLYHSLKLIINTTI